MPSASTTLAKKFTPSSPKRKPNNAPILWRPTRNVLSWKPSRRTFSSLPPSLLPPQFQPLIQRTLIRGKFWKFSTPFSRTRPPYTITWTPFCSVSLWPTGLALSRTWTPKPLTSRTFAYSNTYTVFVTGGLCTTFSLALKSRSASMLASPCTPLETPLSASLA